MVHKVLIFVFLVGIFSVNAEEFNYSFYPKKDRNSKFTSTKKISEINRSYIKTDRYKRMENSPLPKQAEIHSGVQTPQDKDPEIYLDKDPASNFKEQNKSRFESWVTKLKSKNLKNTLVYPSDKKETVIEMEKGKAKSCSSKKSSVFSFLKKPSKGECTKGDCGKSCQKKCGKSCSKSSSLPGCVKGCTKSCCKIKKKCGDKCQKKCCLKVKKKCGTSCKKKCCSSSKKKCGTNCEKACCAAQKASSYQKRRAKKEKVVDFFKTLVTPGK